MKSKSKMTDSRLSILRLLCLISAISSFPCVVLSTDCKAGEYNLELLNKFSPWMDNDGNNTYYISICAKIPHVQTSAATLCPDGTAVCMMEKGGRTHSIGNYTQPLVYTVNGQSKEVVLSFQGDSCASNNDVQKTFIFLKCGKTLGSPKLIDIMYGCNYYFEWYTTAVCYDLPVTDKEVRCYVYDKQEKFDLSPLIKVTGAYLVDSANNRKIYINVCRDIAKDAEVTECIAGSGACRVVDGKADDIGQPEGALEKMSNGDLKLVYTSKNTIAGVIQHTTIVFSCPKRGGSKHPVLMSDFGGDYQIKWVTEHACPESYLTSKTCQLTSEQHDVDIDLSPLTKAAGSQLRYSTEGNKGIYMYYINICKELGIPCSKRSVDDQKQTTVCQTKPEEPDFAKGLGRKDSQILKYADGELTLTYNGGDPCHTNFHRKTVISFHCNETADIGKPVFNYHSNCSYYFDWDTKHACPDHPNIEECRATHNGQIYDLGSLVREQGNNWQAVIATHDMEGKDVFINMCHDLIQGGVASGCKKDSSVCLKDGSVFQSLGKYSANPIYQSSRNSVQITYTDGDPCSSGKIKSIFNLMCRIGDRTSAPVLTDVSDDRCVYIFEWYTFAACPLKHVIGDNCRIVDSGAGFNFDLSRLSKTDGYYSATIPLGHAYDYYINVCRDVKIESGDCSTTPHAGVCQVKKGEVKTKHNTGQTSSKLAYFDGMINLTYSGGDLYNSKPPAPRKTEIMFTCNMSVGAGNPVYVTETNQTYMFQWDTKYACLSQPIECIVKDEKTGKQYDLSRLSKTGTDNWEKTDQQAPNTPLLTYYINVCQPLNPIDPVVHSVECGDLAAVCLTTTKDGKQTVEHGNLGQVTSGPVVENGYPKIVYTNGDSCIDETGAKTTFSTTIHFRCMHGEVEKGPLTPVKNRQCEYVAVWQTEAACPINETIVEETCIIKDPSSNYVFNLQHLKKNADQEPYSVRNRDSTKTYKLNICGGTSACPAIGKNESSVCYVQGGSTVSVSYSKPHIEFSSEGKLRLFYDNPRDKATGALSTVSILFSCNQTKEPGEFSSVKELGGNNLEFEFVTAAACSPAPVQCLAVDEEGEEYNLQPLADENKAWEVVDPKRLDLKYYISVCKPLPPSTAASCTGEAIGGCQTSGDRGQSYNIGFIQSAPVAVKNSVTLRYRNGDLCHIGKANQAHRSMTINFICSSQEHHPVFDGETSTCEYLFSWFTPSACPAKQIIGSNCKVTDPLYNYEFDLSSLHKQKGSYSVPSGEYTYIINVCGGIDTAKGECSTSTGSCQTKSDTSFSPINAGVANDKLMYYDGEISLKYVDGRANCHGKYNRTTIIVFECAHSTVGSEGPHDVKENEVCTYIFTWKTMAACPPHKVVDCTVFDKNGQEYDLSSLTLTSDNYNIIDPLYPKKKYIINVCRTLVHQKGETCEFSAASCLIDSSGDKTSYHNLGEVGDAPLALRDNDKHLLLYYENGEPCNGGKNRTQTVIVLRCNPESIDTRPVGHFMVDQCSHRFVWETRAACPVKSQATSEGNCTAVNPATGYAFDFSILSVLGTYEVRDNRTYNRYKLEVCRPVSDVHCGVHSGVCQHNQMSDVWHHLGSYNSNLQYKDGILILNYTGGDACDGGFRRNTIINFVCSEKAGNGQPEFVRSTACTYIFNWMTSLACEEQVKCSVVNGDRIIDLSPLIKSEGHYLAPPDPTFGQSQGGLFYINPCRPLNPIHGVLCPPGSGACHVKDGKAISLGKVMKPPRMDPQSSQQVILEYANGSACAIDKTKENVARILFSCKEGSSLGQPKLLAESVDCVYLFLWETYLVCSSPIETVLSNCTYYDSQTNQYFNLSALKESDSKVSLRGSSLTYYVSFCKSLSNPKNTNYTVMSVDNNNKRKFYGAVDQGKFVMDGSNLYLRYNSDENCEDAGKKRSTEIIFKPDCEATKTSRALEFAGWNDCKLTFLMKTSLVCPAKVTNCVVSNGDSTFDLSVLSREDSWKITKDGNSYWINVCRSVSRQPDCPKNAAVCRKSANGVDMLGSIETQKLHMDSDGKTILLEYSEGMNACSHTRRRSENESAKTVIKFLCGNTVGLPKLVSVEPECVFTFEWKSRLACKIERKSVTEKDGKVQDPRTGGHIDLTKLSTSKYYPVKPPNAVDKMQYLINPVGEIHPDWPVTGGNPCKGAAVCQIKETDASYHKSLGLFSNRTYYVEDDVLEIQFASADKCVSDNTKNVKTLLILKCQADAVKTKPQFVYQSQNCFYYFKWDTYVACPQGDIITPGGNTDNGGNSSSSSGGVKPKTLGIVIAVFSGIILISILLIVFHKPERRAACASRVKHLFGKSSRKEAIYKYSMLSQDALEEGDDINEDSITDNTDTGVTIANHDLPSYHDDSDEDLLV